MKISAWIIGGLVSIAPGLGVAQQSTLAGPVAGFVFDSPSHVLRPIQGIPGASLLGDPVDFGFDLSAAWVSPAQDTAFVLAADSSLHFFKLNGGKVSEVSLGGLSGAPQTVVFSPSGTAAALFAAGRARVLTGLPNSPSLVGTVSIPDSGQPVVTRGEKKAPVRAIGAGLALSDDGSYMAGISQGSVRLLGIHGDSRILLTAQSDSLVAFAAGGHDVAVVDSVAGLNLIRNASGTGTPQVVAAPDTGMANPVGLAFSRDSQTLYVASASAQSVAAFGLAGASRSDVSCNCTPTMLVPMGNVFRLGDYTSAPLWLLDTGASKPRTVFVPARAE